MDLALDLARLGIGRTSPNPAVGTVLVRDGEIVGRGFHTWRGVNHAEVEALREAGERARGATAYVTLEPCSHQGRTGPCADSLIQAGVTRVVAPIEDPNPEVAGSGFARLRKAGIAVEIDSAHAEAALQINEAFVHSMRTGRPLVTLKAALTLDGKIAARAGDTGWITSAQAREHAQTLRHTSDAILTGIGTVLADDPLLTDRTGQERSRPLLRIVLDSKLRIPAESRLVQTAANDLVIVTTAAADPVHRETLEHAGIRICEGGLATIIEFLAREKYRSLLIEAGANVNASVFEAGIADKIFFYYAPKILGGLDSLPAVGGVARSREKALHLERLTLHNISPDEFAVEAYVHRNH
jgi:diaminohydroxyphosphoribosylaminopyrimidine deaminase/5-amino-6-(5-phosphoribosylamino)uracil reductase